jgi:hypothetical protein
MAIRYVAAIRPNGVPVSPVTAIPTGDATRDSHALLGKHCYHDRLLPERQGFP